MPECVFGPRAERGLVDELCRNEIAQGCLDPESLQHVWREPRPDDRRSVQRALGGGVEAVDAGGDHRLQRAGHMDVADRINAQIAAATAYQHVALAQVPHDLLGEEGIPGRTLRDELGKLGDRSVLAQKFGAQRQHLRFIQRLECNRLRARCMSKRTSVFGPICDDDQ